MGGSSAEREISLLTGNGVLNALREKGVDAHAFDPVVHSLFDLPREKFDRVFIALHGRFGEDGTVQGVLETMKIPYTGSGGIPLQRFLQRQLVERSTQRFRVSVYIQVFSGIGH